MIIEIKGLKREFAVGSEIVKALKGVDVSVMKNEYLAMMGPSGSGKSTLMNLLGCLDTPTAGAYNLIAGLLQQEHKFYTHTLHLQKPDPHCELNHVPIGGVHQRLNFLMTNAMGLGGTNSCIILEFR